MNWHMASAMSSAVISPPRLDSPSLVMIARITAFLVASSRSVYSEHVIVVAFAGAGTSGRSGSGSPGVRMSGNAKFGNPGIVG